MDPVLARLRLAHPLENESGTEPRSPLETDVGLAAMSDLAAEQLTPKRREAFRIGAIDDDHAEDDVRVIGVYVG